MWSPIGGNGEDELVRSFFAHAPGMIPGRAHEDHAYKQQNTTETLKTNFIPERPWESKKPRQTKFLWLPYAAYVP